MNDNLSSLEPPSKCVCHVDIQCHYADINVPSDVELNSWVKQTIHYLIQNNLLLDTDIDLSILIVDKIDSQLLNMQYRQQDKATNVLSFPFDTPAIFKQQQPHILGDIIICAPIIELESQQQNKNIPQHWAHIVVHGVLHLLGYDHIHNNDAQVMENLEITILSNLGYPNPYMESLS